jgi:hypothetical protein
VDIIVPIALEDTASVIRAWLGCVESISYLSYFKKIGSSKVRKCFLFEN